MKLPRSVSGTRLVDALCRSWGYVKVHQVGSHIVLESREPPRHRIAVPDHHTLRIGTLHSILRDVAAHLGVPREKIIDSL